MKPQQLCTDLHFAHRYIVQCSIEYLFGLVAMATPMLVVAVVFAYCTAGSGRVTFSSYKSYVKAVSAAFVEIKTAKFTKKVFQIVIVYVLFLE